MSSLDIAPAPEGCGKRFRIPAAGAGTGIRRLSGGRAFAPAGDWASGNQAFAISRGSSGSSPHTPGHESRHQWHAVVPFLFRVQVSHWTQGLSPPIPPYSVGDMSERLVAQGITAAGPSHTDAGSPPPVPMPTARR